MIRTFTVSDKNDFHDIYCFVKAENDHRARAVAMRVDESDSLRESGYIELRAHRCPKYDESMTWADLVRNNDAWTECPGCESRIHDLDEVCRYHKNEPETCGPAFVANGAPWCSQECYDANPQRHGRMEGQQSAICLYSE